MNIIEKIVNNNRSVDSTKVEKGTYETVCNLPLHTQSRLETNQMNHRFVIHFDDAVAVLNVDFSSNVKYALCLYTPDEIEHKFDCSGAVTYVLDSLLEGKTAPILAKILELATAVTWGDASRYAVDLDEANKLTGLDVKFLGGCKGLLVYSDIGESDPCHVFAKPLSVITDGNFDGREVLCTMRKIREDLDPSVRVNTFDDVLAVLNTEARYVDEEYLDVILSNGVQLMFAMVDGRPLLVHGTMQRGDWFGAGIAQYVFSIVEIVDNRRNAAANAGR